MTGYALDSWGPCPNCSKSHNSEGEFDNIRLTERGGMAQMEFTDASNYDAGGKLHMSEATVAEGQRVRLAFRLP